MKLTCSQSELNSALQLVSRAVAIRPTHPVLANVLLTADAGTERISLTGFDLNLGIQTSINASIEHSGAVTLPSKYSSPNFIAIFLLISLFFFLDPISLLILGKVFNRLSSLRAIF